MACAGCVVRFFSTCHSRHHFLAQNQKIRRTKNLTTMRSPLCCMVSSVFIVRTFETKRMIDVNVTNEQNMMTNRSLSILCFLYFALKSLLSSCHGFVPQQPAATSLERRRLSATRVATYTDLKAATSNDINDSNKHNNDESNFEYYEEEDFDAYARDLDPKEVRSQVENENKQYQIVDRTSLWLRAIRYPFRILKKTRKKPGKLILLRCGASEWSANQTFTGWADPDLTVQGIKESQHAARLLLSEGYQPDIVYTSRLKRAVRSSWTVLEEINSLHLPVYKSWRLNERSYGALTGLSKAETAKRFGAKTVQAWRNNIKARPPPMKRTDPWYPGNDDRYSDLEEADQIPLTESLMDTMDRCLPLWEYKIRYDIQNGNNVLIVGHGNTLRGVIKTIDNIGDRDIEEVTIPAGVPFVYHFHQDTDGLLTPTKPPDGSLSQIHTNGKFLEKPGLLEVAMEKQAEWDSKVPGLDDDYHSKQDKKRTTNVEDSLLLLKREQALESWAEKQANVKSNNANANGNGILVNGNAAFRLTSPKDTFDDPSEFEDFSDDAGTEVGNVAVNMMPLEENGGSQSDDGPVVVFIRHGRTPHNNLGLFTGWEDPPLAPDGVEDAISGGRLLKRHRFKFDVVYCSWLQRAIQTAWYVIDELDMLHLPMIKSWRLNERMYGALTGKSKAMVANEYGEEQLVKWRRGFKIRPPPVSSYSLSYPGNDYSRTKYVKDLRISWSETINRSLEERRFRIHRKFPKHESLHDCMQRSIPYYTDRIMQEAVSKGKRVLIASHENAIRGILMHLCGIPEEAMNKLHLPNGVPLVYNVKGKCISLLDDGSGIDPMEKYDFGPAAKYLFKPCELYDDFFDEMEKKAAPSLEESVAV